MDVNQEVIVHINKAVFNRYDNTQRVLNLSNFRKDCYLQGQGLFIALSRPKVLMSVVRFINENLPDIVGLDLSNNMISNLQALSSLSQSCKMLKILDLSNNKVRILLFTLIFYY